MSDQREGFLFYRSFYEAIHSLPKKDRLAAYEAVIEYALNGTEPELSGAPAAVFTLAKPNLDASKRKAESGKRGGMARSKPEANCKQNVSKPEAIKDKGLRIKDEGQGIKDEGVTPVVPCGGHSAVISAYRNRINPSASQYSLDELTAYAQAMGDDVCLRAMDIALDAKAANWNYVRGILRKWQAKGVKCLADIERLDKKPDTRQSVGKFGKGPVCSDYSAPDAGARLRSDMDKLKLWAEMAGGESG